MNRQENAENKPKSKQEQIVLERSAWLNLDPGRGDYRVTGVTMIICKRPDPPDDNMQKASSSRWSFARGRNLRMIICNNDNNKDNNINRGDGGDQGDRDDDVT